MEDWPNLEEIELWVYEVSLFIEDDVQFILDKATILGLKNNALQEYLAAEKKMLINKLDHNHRASFHIKELMSLLNTGPLSEFIITTITKFQPDLPVSKILDEAREYIHVIEILNIISEIDRTLLEIVNPKAKRKKLTFKKLFFSSEDEDWVKKVFESNSLTQSGRWVGYSGNKTELLAAYYELREIGKIRPVPKGPGAKLFYAEFGIDVEQYLAERNLTTESWGANRYFFKDIFSKKL